MQFIIPLFSLNLRQEFSHALCKCQVFWFAVPVLTESLLDAADRIKSQNSDNNKTGVCK